MIRNLTGKNARYESVFIDLDGTITDSGEGCINGIRYMFERIGYAENDEKRLRAFVGPPVKKHLVREYSFSEADAAYAYAFYREYYDDKGVYENSLYDGIIESLTSIKQSGKTLYIATTKPMLLAARVLDMFGLTGMFSDVFTARHESGIYEKSEVLESAVSELGSVPCPVMIGDRCYDILGGRHVGFDTVGVLYGYGDEDELLGADCDFTADSPQDLAVLLGEGS
jgi:phosphoglycolate phosphatase